MRLAKYTFFALTLINLFCSTVTVSQPSITWSKIYSPSQSSDEALAICSSGNGFYYVGGHAFISFNFAYLMKINENGDTLWSKSTPQLFDIWAITATPDNGCIIAGGLDSVIRIDVNGNIVWKRNFGLIYSTIKSIIRTQDGNYIACGYREQQSDGIILKFDVNGSLQWSHLYPTGGLKILTSIDELPNSGFIVAGSNKDFSGDTTKALLMRINPLGAIVWEKKYKVLNKAASGNFVKKIPNGFIVSGATTDTAIVPENQRVYFIRTDTTGILKFTKLFPNNKHDNFVTAQYINDNKFIFSSFVNGDTSYNKVILTDTLGTVLASKNFYSPLFLNQFYSIIKADNDDIILAGSARIMFRSDDFLICRVDSNLNGPPIGIIKINTEIPQKFALHQNYPNPFNPTTKISFDIPKNAVIKIKICDILGQEVFYINEFRTAGSYEVKFDGSNLASGMYFYQVEAGNFKETKKMVLIK